MISDPAPVILFTYNRLWHTQQTVEALKRNGLSQDSHLVIYSDGPKNRDDIADVEKVRNYLERIDGFGGVRIIERSENLGTARSVVQGVTEIVDQFGKAIVLEDDLVTSPHFLKYMNDALTFYAADDRVVSIHGYIYPVKGSLPETFFLRGADCWGWATWKRGWDLYEDDGSKLLQSLRSGRLTKCFDLDGAYPYTKMLKDTIKGSVSSWAVKWHASAFLENRLTLYPGRSLVDHIGADGTGVHSETSGLFNVKPSEISIKVEKVSVMENPQVREMVVQFFSSLKRSLPDRAVDYIRRKLNPN